MSLQSWLLADKPGAPAPTAMPIIIINPSSPAIPDTTPLGGVVAQYQVVMSDASAFVGTLVFAAPNFDAGGIFALSGTAQAGNIIVNPSGPGVGPNMGTIVDNITLQAAQP